MTRARALVAANALLAIFAFALIMSERQDDEKLVSDEAVVLGSDAASTEALRKLILQRHRAVAIPQGRVPRAEIVPGLEISPADDYRLATGPVTTTPTAKPDVEVSLDPAGRPYDVAVPPGATIERRRLTVIHAPSRRVAFMGGEEVPYPYADKHKTIQLAERPRRLYPVDAIRLHERSGAGRIVGVVIVERDTPIARWRTLQETAYGTDAGLGAITTREWLNTPEGPGGNVLARHLDRFPKQGFFVANVDGRPGVDTVVFDNGFGDGGFPAVAGYDVSGARAAIVLWTIVVPWRMAFPQGEPPQRVTRREDALASCVAGRRAIDGAHCRLARPG